MKKKVLVLLPYENMYPPMNGGNQRSFHLLHQIATYFEVTVIVHQEREAFLRSIGEFPALAHVKVYSTKDFPAQKDIFSLLPARIQTAIRYRWIQQSWAGTADGNFLTYYPVLKKLLKEEKFDVVVLETMVSINAARLVRRLQKNAFIIFDTHNVDSSLAREEFNKGLIRKENFESILDIESNLYRKVDAVFACSEVDKKGFESINKGPLPVAVIPNGVKLNDVLMDAGVKMPAPDYIIFCGSLGYHPNIEGLLWFYRSIWPIIKQSLPALKLIVLGSGKPTAEIEALQKDTDLWFTGRVPDVKEYYEKAALSVVPLKSGSGTRLKILEALNLGVPVISTTKGAEGIDYTAAEDLVIADTETAFAQEVIQVIKSMEKRLSLQKKGRLLIEKKYDWDMIGKKIQSFIGDIPVKA
ncbi:MAG TPA: glycosyltransferase family 4 protein [Ferruginibacter sp.]|nr:glycosyltransferase family 4 protein [Ferruginibacter sp.]